MSVSKTGMGCTTTPLKGNPKPQRGTKGAPRGSNRPAKGH